MESPGRSYSAAKILPLIVILSSLLSASSRAERMIEYQGTARLVSEPSPGPVVYVERHRVTLTDDGRPLRAETRYESPEGRLLAELQSDFRESLTVPSHITTDHRSGNSHGLRRDNGQVVLFDRMPGKPERTRILTAKDAGDRLLVGCQGLNYYLTDHLDRLTPPARLPLRFLIPGKLDYYDFGLTSKGTSPEGIAEFEVTIQNWFLRLFAPKLEVKYDTTRRRLVWYRGISNILNDQGENQAVEITYSN